MLAARLEIDRLTEQMAANQSLIDKMLQHEGQIWRLYPPSPPITFKPPAESSHAKIVLVANNKGGVGKTTLVMYLAHYFAGLGKRVLAIDLDPQGSLTRAMLTIGDVVIPPAPSHRLAYVNQLLTEAGPARWNPEVLGGRLRGVDLATADQTLGACPLYLGDDGS